MLFSQSHAWTPGQRWLIAGAVVAGLVVFSALVYSYEHHYRRPDESFFVGTWRGEFVNALSNYQPGYRFKADHTYEQLISFGDTGSVVPAGTWYAGGDFIYLRVRLDDGSGPHTRLEAWHIDAMKPAELRIHYGPSTVALKRVQ
jgi:hypothetical protein